VNTDLIARVKDGDEVAFRHLVEGYRRELQLHCYRILGSAQDAEDAVQETFLAAWQGIAGFKARASVRTWLYRIATRRCRDARRSARRRPELNTSPPAVPLIEPTSSSPAIWLEPYPDILLEEVSDPAPGPEARYEARESISLAFVSALQFLPPRQRVVLVLRDVLGFRSKEVAAMLETTEESVSSALKHARTNLHKRLPAPAEPPPPPDSAVERDLVERLTRAYEVGDVDAVVAMLSEDVVLTAPLAQGSYEGRAIADRVLRSVVFRDGLTYRLIATRANGQPAFGLYARDRLTDVAHANGMMVLTLTGSRVSAMTRFDNSVLPLFGLPRTLPDDV
jgi:RNA polymerase sigma-70 factor (TIGR02960 family)